MRVTLAHEMTHVLQGQYFDLSRMDKMASSGEQLAFQTLVEGDAVRVEHAYIASLPPADQSAYTSEQNAQQGASSASLGNVPESLVTLFGAPYELGPQLVKVLLAKGGNTAVDDAMRNPPLDEVQVFDPWVYLAHTQPAKVAGPSLDKGQKRFDGGDFGALSWYVVLTQRIDPSAALAAADAWGGDAYVAYTTKDGRSCVRADISPASPAGATPLLYAFNAWAQAMPSGTATITHDPGGIGLASCDPGTRATMAPIPTAAQALILPVSRTGFTLATTAAGAPLAFARCAGTRVAGFYSEAELLDPSGAAFLSPKGRAKLAQVLLPCRTQTP